MNWHKNLKNSEERLFEERTNKLGLTGQAKMRGPKRVVCFKIQINLRLHIMRVETRGAMQFRCCCNTLINRRVLG